LRRPQLPPPQEEEEGEKYERYLATMSTEKLEQIDSKYFGLPSKKTSNNITVKTSGRNKNQLHLSRNILGGDEYHYKDENGDGGVESESDNNESTTLLNKSKQQQQQQQQQPHTLATEHYFPIHSKPQGTFPMITFLRSLFLLLIGSIFLCGGLYRWYYNPVYITEEVQPQLGAMGIEQSTQPTELAPFFILSFLTLSPALYQLISIICAALNCCDMTYLDIANE